MAQSGCGVGGGTVKLSFPDVDRIARIELSRCCPILSDGRQLSWCGVAGGAVGPMRVIGPPLWRTGRLNRINLPLRCATSHIRRFAQLWMA